MSLLRSLACAAMLLWPAAVSAENLIVSYYTFLGPTDRVNSSGAPLTSFGAILAQDRANYHRFDRRDQSDGPDPLFTTPDMRQRLVNVFDFNSTVTPYIRQNVLFGRGNYVFVRVFGFGGQMERVVVSEGAG